MDDLDRLIASMNSEMVTDLMLSALLKNAVQPDASDFLHVAFALGHKLEDRGIDPLPLLGSFQRLSESMASVKASAAPGG